MKTEQPRTIYLKDYRPPAYLIEETRLDVALHPSETRVQSRLRMKPNPAWKGKAAALALDGEKLKLERIAINGEELGAKDYKLTDASLTVPGPPAEPFILEITTVCDPEANEALTGLYRSRGMYCTQCEAQGFRRITYYPDRPDVMAKFRVRLEAEKAGTPVLLANGNLVETGDIPGSSRHYAVWEDPFPKPSYLFAMVGGDLACVRDSFTTASGRKVDLRIYVEPGKEDRCAWAMESLKRAMRWDEERFGLEYDLDIFMIVAVSDFNMGAMENKGLNVFNDKLILARPDTAADGDYEAIEAVIAHEYFHNWTGNRVTCRDWFQLCLKEGLTVFRDQEFTSDVRSRTVKRIEDVRVLKALQFQEDGGPLAHPVRPESFIEINNFYTITIYEKGAELCRMIQTLVGRDGFRKGLDLYFQRHDGQAVTVEDFVAAMAGANGADLSQFMLWYSQAGTPELTCRMSYSPANKTARLTVKQDCPPTPGQPKKRPRHIPLKLALLGANGCDLPLKLNGGGAVKDGLLHIVKRKQSFEFAGLEERPIPSLLRGFSAPVKLVSNLSERDLEFLMDHDSDLFNRWQSAQTLALKMLIRMVNAIREGQPAKPGARFAKAIGKTIMDETLEPAYRANFMAMPGELAIAQAIGADIDPEAIYQAREQLRAALGRALKEELASLYDKHLTGGPYSPDAASAGKRALRSSALALMAAGASRTAISKVRAHYQNASNMTDAMVALGILSRLDTPARRPAFDDFYKKWKDDHIVIDKWFGLQTSSPLPDTIERVAELSQHPLFSLKTPNKVRAVYGAFAHGNLVRFNDASGRGYDITANAVLELDGFNPQIAARLLGAFESWRMLEPARQALAKTALERVAAKDGLSRDTLEIVTKILN